MIVKTKSLTESLEKLYEAYEVETEDELDAIMDDDTLSDEEKEAEIGRVLDKHDKLNEAENPENAEINAIIRKNIGKRKKYISKKDLAALEAAGITVEDDGDMTGKNGRKLMKYGTAIHGPGKTYHKYPKTDYRKGHDGKTTRWDLRKNSADMVGSRHADKWDKVDLKNYLDSEQPYNAWETEQESDKKLRPYSDKYQEYKHRKDSASWGVDRANRDIKSEEEIERMVQEYRDKLLQQRQHDLEWAADREGSKEYYDKQIKDLQAQAKAKHPQYESLNEDADYNNEIDYSQGEPLNDNFLLLDWYEFYDDYYSRQWYAGKDDEGVEIVVWPVGDEYDITVTVNNRQRFYDRMHFRDDDAAINFAEEYYREEISDKFNESLNEAQLNENPLIAAAARAAIPAAIDVASNAISSVIDAKLNDSKDTELNEAEGSDNELSFDEIMAKEKTSGNMDWYKKDKPNWKQVTEEE